VPIDQNSRYHHAGEELDENESTMDNNRGNFKDRDRDGDRDRDHDYKADFRRDEGGEGSDNGDGDGGTRGSTIKNANDHSCALNKSYLEERTAAPNANAATKDRIFKDELEEKHAVQYNYNSQGSSDSDGVAPGNTRTSTTQRASTGGANPSRLQQRAINNSVQIRGDRVRRGVNVQRSTSSKVLTRHQVQTPATQAHRGSTGSTAAGAGASAGIGKINAVSSGTDDNHSPIVHPAESKQGQGHIATTADDLSRSFKAHDLSASLAAARKVNAENAGASGVAAPIDMADSKLALKMNNASARHNSNSSSDVLNRSFKELDLAETKIKLINANGNNGNAVSHTPRQQEVEADVLYAPDFETTISVTKSPRYEAKASAKDIYEHTNDATINQQVGLLSGKSSAHMNTHADAVLQAAASRAVSHDADNGEALVDDEIDRAVVTTVEVTNGLGHVVGNDDAIQDDVKVAGGGTTESSRQSAMNTVNSILSKGSKDLSDPRAVPNANAHLPARERRESWDGEEIASYEDDFEDYDDELVNLYQPQEEHPKKEQGGEYYPDDEEDEDDQQGQQLSSEYLAHFGGAVASAGAKGAQPKGALIAEENEFKASLRHEQKLDSKDTADQFGHGQRDRDAGDEATFSDHMSNDSLEEDSFEARREIDEMLYWITDTREILTKSLGAGLFESIYTLCKDNMTEQLDSSRGTKDVTYLHEIQKKLQEHLHASLEAVLGTVMQVKALLAWEDELARKNLGLNSETVNSLQEF